MPSKPDPDNPFGSLGNVTGPVLRPDKVKDCLNTERLQQVYEQLKIPSKRQEWFGKNARKIVKDFCEEAKVPSLRDTASECITLAQSSNSI